LASGYEYFQGYFFSRPVTHSTRKISGNKLNRLRILEQVNRPELSYEELDKIICQDVALSYKLLRYMNSAWFGLRYPIESIKRALVQLGAGEIRKWAALVTLRDMGEDKPNELLLMSMRRAKMSEIIGAMAEMGPQSPELFLMGMFSVIDALLDAPIQDILGKLPLDEQIKMALLGKDCPFGNVYNAVRTYEKGAWDDFAQYAVALNLDIFQMPETYAKSLRWAEDAFAVL